MLSLTFRCYTEWVYVLYAFKTRQEEKLIRLTLLYKPARREVSSAWLSSRLDWCLVCYQVAPFILSNNGMLLKASLKRAGSFARTFYALAMALSVSYFLSLEI